MKKTSILVIIIALSLSLFGQGNDTIVQKAEEKSAAIQDELWNRINLLTLQVASKDKAIKQLKEDSIAMQSVIAEQNRHIEELETTVFNANTVAEKSKKDYEAIRQAVLSKDAVLYKQCLFYPLSRRYNPALIDDALVTVNIFAGLGQMSDKFEEYRNTYEPLLRQYESYNQELINYLQGCVDYIELREKKLGDGRQIPIPDNWLTDLKKLPYYKECYVGKDTPPYKSIIYLDDAIDEFLDAIQRKDGVKLELQKLVKKLEPKKN